MVGEPLASVLRSGRDVFNGKFLEARRRYPTIDVGAFSGFLESTLDPVAKAVPLKGDEFASWVQSAYDVALELAGEGLLGADAKGRLMQRAWREIVPALAPGVLLSSERVLGSLCNAVQNLWRTRGARPAEWISAIAAISHDCRTANEFLQLGQLLAWRSGMAHLREGALQVAATMPGPLVLAALGAAKEANLSSLLQRLATDVWFDPSESGATISDGALRALRRVGSFRGFGGEFVAPPVVAASGNQLFVRSADDTWLLIADVFGVSLHRSSLVEFEAAKRSAVPVLKIQVTPTSVAVAQQQAAIQMPGTITSFAVLSHTIAVTSSYTHGVQLLAR